MLERLAQLLARKNPDHPSSRDLTRPPQLLIDDEGDGEKTIYPSPKYYRQQLARMRLATDEPATDVGSPEAQRQSFTQFYLSAAVSLSNINRRRGSEILDTPNEDSFFFSLGQKNILHAAVFDGPSSETEVVAGETIHTGALASQLAKEATQRVIPYIQPETLTTQDFQVFVTAMNDACLTISERVKSASDRKSIQSESPLPTTMEYAFMYTDPITQHIFLKGCKLGDSETLVAIKSSDGTLRLHNIRSVSGVEYSGPTDEEGVLRAHSFKSMLLRVMSGSGTFEEVQPDVFSLDLTQLQQDLSDQEIHGVYLVTDGVTKLFDEADSQGTYVLGSEWSSVFTSTPTTARALSETDAFIERFQAQREKVRDQKIAAGKASPYFDDTTLIGFKLY